MDYHFTLAEYLVMRDAVEDWIVGAEEMYNVLHSSDPTRKELAHNLDIAKNVRKKLILISRAYGVGN